MVTSDSRGPDTGPNLLLVRQPKIGLLRTSTRPDEHLDTVQYALRSELERVLVVGWRWHEGIGQALLAVGLLLLLRFSLLWVGIFLGLMVKSPEAVAAVQILVWPGLFLSNTFVAPETMPGWLGAISEWNPLSATVAATRELFGNLGWGGETWISRNSLLMAVLWPMVIFALFFPLSVRRYRRLSR